MPARQDAKRRLSANRVNELRALGSLVEFARFEGASISSTCRVLAEANCLTLNAEILVLTVGIWLLGSDCWVLTAGL